MGKNGNIKRSFITLFDKTKNDYLSFNKNFLYKKTLYYLTAQDLNEDEETASKHIFTVSQLGTLLHLDKGFFVKKGRFDHGLLNFFSKFRNRLSFVFITRYHREDEKSYLVRVVITETSPEERDDINEFMANNLEKYNKFTRQTTNYDKRIDDEKIIDIDHVDMISTLPDRIKYKDLVLTFGY
jgi:hypothetical protein